MKIVSWNVNGLRSVYKTTFLDWLKKSDPDILCLQEVKAESATLSPELTEIDSYYSYFNSAQKKGYSGVAVYTKIKPLSIETKLGISQFDEEGRCLKLTFKDFILFNLYIPHGDRMKNKLEYKLRVYTEILKVLAPLAHKPVVLAGDFNIAHTELDLYYPKQNENNIMFTSEERKQLDILESLGFIDTWRQLYPDTKAYTMWPYALGLRERDIGWRIDYIFVTQILLTCLKDAFIEKDTRGSDHAPIGIILDKQVEYGESPVYIKKGQSALF